jgi:hypothetical protein
LALAIMLFATALAPNSRVIGSILFWPSTLLDWIFIPDLDYIDLDIMFASLFISTGSYALVIYLGMLRFFKLKYRLKKLSADERA